MSLSGRTGYRLTSEGQLWIGFALTLALIGWYKKINIILLVSYTMVGLLLVNLVLARLHSRRTRAVRVHLPPVFANQMAQAAITVSDRHERAASVQVVDTAAGASVRWFLHGHSDSKAVLHQPRAMPGRGRYRCDPLLVISGFPFGLVEHSTRMRADDSEQVVLPARGSIDVTGFRRWLARAGGEAGQRRRPLRRITSDQADVRGVRPFRPGDSLRWIHWRTTARRGEPMVREYDVPPSPALLLVVDPWLPAQPGEADLRNLEAALELAATISAAVCEEDASRLTLIVPGLEAAKVSGSTPAALLGALTPLADVHGSPEVASPALRPGRAQSTARLVVSSRPNSPLIERLSRQTGRLFLGLDSTAPPPWYLSPAAAKV